MNQKIHLQHKFKCASLWQRQCSARWKRVSITGEFFPLTYITEKYTFNLGYSKLTIILR